MITQDRLKELLDYDPLTGVFRWKVSRGRVSKGSIAGTEVWVSDNYIRLEIRIDGKRYKAHQLAFLYVYGYIPEEIDHKDRNPLNNAIDNLLDSSKSRNQLK
ncbi:putative HNH endonuclease [Escherichia phage JLBYU40]|uniref:HNH endonuclease n=1 Tax=Escherichia phage JLBYU40 TaxID=2894749 RepID=A0AAE8YZ38_9CAUD|nr:putative HNH endonuclease [Escherichia phage JLBYU40]